LSEGKIGFTEAFAIRVGEVIDSVIFTVLGLSVSIGKYIAPMGFHDTGFIFLLRILL